MYRQFLKVLLKVEDKQYRGQLRVWIRTEFEVAGSQGDHDEVSNNVVHSKAIIIILLVSRHIVEQKLMRVGSDY